MHFIGGRRKASGTVTRTLVNGGAAAVCALVLAVSACASPPDSATPDATPTASAPPTGGVDAGDNVGDDAELFRAAEDTYRAYVDALNRVDAGELPRSQPHRYLTGEALESAGRESDRLAAKEIVVRGRFGVDSISYVEVVGSSASLLVCLDVADTRITDMRGRDVTQADRPDVLGLLVTIVEHRGQFLISDSEAVDAKC